MINNAYARYVLKLSATNKVAVYSELIKYYKAQRSV